MQTFQQWVGAGERVEVELAGRRLRAFRRVSGNPAGPWLTLLHGFPTCSLDWADIAPRLEPTRRLLAFDFIGFGDSDKPRDLPYSIHLQADLVHALWRQLGIERTEVLAHDYGVSVGQELLARSAPIERIAFLNGGLYADLHRPLLVQKLLRHPITGPVVARLVSERTVRRGLTAVFGPEHPPSEEALRELWIGVRQHGGHRIYDRLAHYMADRRVHASRWEQALESSPVPKRFIWGMRDPVSGAHVAARLRERCPASPLTALEDVGHYPQLEAPDRVADAYLAGA